MLKKCIAALTALWLGCAGASAEISIDVVGGVGEPLPIAIPTFESDEGSADIANQITEVIKNDLRLTGLFEIKQEAAFIQRDLSIDVQPRFADWKIIKTDALVVGRTQLLEGDPANPNDDQLRVAFRLWDVYGEEVLRLDNQPGRQYTTTPDNWRRIAHKISDSIYSRLTGENGFFDTRIVYIAETGPKTARVKRLAIMDMDGANHEFLTSGVHTVLTPRFSPNAQQITYMSYEGGTPRVYVFNIETARQEVLGDFRGMTFAPRFTSDGNGVLLTQAQGGNSEIYLMELRSRQTRRLTNHPAIDTSPSMSPNGRRIVFNSDRGGSPQLYVMNTDGSPMNCPSGGRDTACRITFGRGRYSTPVWSPRGDLIAFTKQTGGKFHIGVIRPDGDGERLLSEAYLDEGPEWSPNGRVVTFFRENYPGAGPRLWSVDLTGRNLRQLNTTTDASDPAWSPLLD